MQSARGRLRIGGTFHVDINVRRVQSQPFRAQRWGPVNLRPHLGRRLSGGHRPLGIAALAGTETPTYAATVQSTLLVCQRVAPLGRTPLWFSEKAVDNSELCSDFDVVY